MKSYGDDLPNSEVVAREVGGHTDRAIQVITNHIGLDLQKTRAVTEEQNNVTNRQLSAVRDEIRESTFSVIERLREVSDELEATKRRGSVTRVTTLLLSLLAFASSAGVLGLMLHTMEIVKLPLPF